jgi:hypothetical protein
VEREGFKVRRLEAVGLPLDVLTGGAVVGRLLRVLDQISLSIWPAMFGYQFILEIEPE